MSNADSLRQAAMDYILNESVPAYTTRWYALAEALLPEDACEQVGFHICGQPDAEVLRAALASLPGEAQ